jgi:hypothetical protein
VTEPFLGRPVAEAPNRAVWELLGEELPALDSGRPRSPYLEQGCHPDVVGRLWTDLAPTLPGDCRAQAKGRPVLAHPVTDVIFALARGTSYALWLTPDDVEPALAAGASALHTWAGGRVTDLATAAGPGWIWGCWHPAELDWVGHAYAALSRT